MEGRTSLRTGCGVFSTLLYDLFDLFSNWRFVAPFALNQLGSVLFTYTLGTSPLSLAIPACNGFAFLFTALARYAGTRFDFFLEHS